jgi:hypothetical protein
MIRGGKELSHFETTSEVSTISSKEIDLESIEVL